MTLSAFSPVRLGPLTLRNRLVRTAAFEGMCQDGIPTPALTEHHRSMAAGGVGLTIVAYCAVSADGRTFPHQIHLRPEVLPELRRLTDAVHAEGAAAALQLGHAGYFADKHLVDGKPLGASRKFCLYGMSRSREMSEAEIRRIVADFGRGAALAAEAGFDAVEIHAGHGYLLSQFLSPFTNRRKDAWGGDLAARLRLPLEVLAAVRAGLGPTRAVIVKLNLEDGFKKGLQIAEAVEAARAFEAAGADALFLSGGFVSKTPFYMLRGELPVREMVQNQASWVNRMGLTLFGRILVQEYPFEELFFLERARAVRAAVKLPLVYVGGVVSRANLEQVLAEGFDLVALGRALIRDPEFPHRLERGEIERSDCDHCNRCVAEMERSGVRCVCPPAGQKEASCPS